MEEVISNISQKYFNSKPRSIEQILDKGKVNQVFKIQLDNEFYIFRFNEKAYLNSYKKEWYCINKVREIGIPTSDVCFVGVEGDYSFMILKYIEGVNGLDVPEEEHKNIYKTLGEYAKKFNSIEVDGFGRDVEDEEKGFYKDWNSFYKENIGPIFEDNILVEKNIVTKEQVEIIQNRLSEIESWNFTPKLCHGNLHISNTITSSDGSVHVIDWGNGVGYVAPHVDLADLIAWKDRKYLDDFLGGYGMSREEFNKIEHDINSLLIVQLLQVIKRFVGTEEESKNNFISNSIERIMKLV